MIFTPASLPGSFLIDLEPFSDDRGWFARSYCEREFERIGHTKRWVQLNHSKTYNKGAIRGMHYQLPPFREIKMVRCIAGAVYDVIIDIRKDSPTFLQWFGVELTADNKRMIYIPEGFAHGFQCLTDNCELIYHHTEFFTPNAEGGIRYDDPMVKISWPLPAGVLSARDAGHPYLTDDFKGI